MDNAVMEDWRRKFICRLAELKKSEGMTQARLAEKLNVSQGTVANWARGSNEPRNRQQYHDLEAALHLPAGTLIGTANQVREPGPDYAPQAESQPLDDTAVAKATEFIFEHIGPEAMKEAGAALCAKDIIFLYNLFKDPGHEYLQPATILCALESYQFIKRFNPQ